MKNPSPAQYRALMPIAEAIAELEPWHLLTSTDHPLIRLPNDDTDYFISTLGELAQCYGVVIIPGREAMREFIDRFEEPMYDITYRNINYTLYYGPDRELLEQDRRAIRDSGIVPADEELIPYVRILQPEGRLRMATADQIDVMIRVLTQYYELIRDAETIQETDFVGGDTVVREYDSQAGEWRNSIIEFPDLDPDPETWDDDDWIDAPEMYPRYVPDKAQIAKLLRQKKLKTVVEYASVPRPRGDGEPDEVVYAIVDAQSRIRYDVQAAQADDFDEKAQFDALAGVILKNGKPFSVRVCDPDLLAAIESGCASLRIPVVLCKECPAARAAAEAFGEEG